VIWAFVDVLGRRLVLWAVLSVLAGAAMLAWGDAFWRGVGFMFVAWGVIDGLIGVAGRWFADRNRRRLRGDADAPAREATRIRRILWINAGLDVLYIAGGAWLLATAGDAGGAGAGLGIVLQGAFLLVFDVAHARWVPSPDPILPADLDIFTGPEHRAFSLAALGPDGAEPAGSRDGALLLHGFGGSPAELRGIAAVLASDGWLVEVPLLPGFGAGIRELPDVRLEDWIAEAEAAAGRVRAEAGGRLLVVGHSMGASLALGLARSLRPDALALLAPFWWPEPPWLRPVAPLVRTVLPPGIRPFRRMDMDSPDVRRGMASFMPGMNLDDPDVRTHLRDLVVPLSIFEQLFRASRLGAAGSRHVHAPVLAIQGLADETSRPERTRTLLGRLPTPPRLVELDAGHDLMTEASPVRDRTLATVLAFAREMREGRMAADDPRDAA
jgi:alpha-beta hydrolase superfamily lysophospholipase